MQPLMPPPVPPHAITANHAMEEKIAIFIVKTFNLVNQAAESGMTGWTDSGTHLAIFDVEGFTRLLPNFFRHANFRSFIRQLNCYGFRKFRSEEIRQLQGAAARAEAVFHHPHFQRGRQDLLHLIRIKKDGDSSEVDELRGEITALQEQVAQLAGLVRMVVHCGKRRRQSPAEPYSPAAVVEDLEHSHSMPKRTRISRGTSPEATIAGGKAAAAAVAAATAAAAATLSLPVPLLTSSSSLDMPSLARLASNSSFTSELGDLSCLLGLDETTSDHQHQSQPAIGHYPKLPGLRLTEKSVENLLENEDASSACTAPPALPDLLCRISVSGVAPLDPSQ